MGTYSYTENESDATSELDGGSPTYTSTVVEFKGHIDSLRGGWGAIWTLDEDEANSVSDAYVRLTYYNQSSTNTINGSFKIIANPNAWGTGETPGEQFTDSGVSATTWNVGTASGGYITSPECSSELQDALDNVTWSSGTGQIAFIWMADIQGAVWRQCYSRDHAQPGPELQYDFETDFDGDTTTTAAVSTLTVPTPGTEAAGDAEVTATAASVTITAGASTGSGPSETSPTAASVSVGCGTHRVTVTQTITADDGDTHDYDIHLPTTDAPAGGWHVVHWVHGGNWSAGGREISDATENYCPTEWAAAVLDAGYVLVTSEYSHSAFIANGFDYLCTNPTQPLAIKDVKTQAKEVQDSDFNLNLDFYYLAGHSAGTQLALLVALSVGDTNEYTGYENLNWANNNFPWYDTNIGRNGWYTGYGGSWTASTQIYEYNYRPWGGGTAPSYAKSTADDCLPFRGVFAYSPIWQLQEVQNEGTAQADSVRTYFGHTLAGVYTEFYLEGDPDDYVVPTSGNVHHDTRTSKRLPTTLGLNGGALSIGVAYSEDDTTIPPEYGVEALYDRYTTEGLSTDSSVNQMTTAEESVLDAEDVTRGGLTRIALPSGTTHANVVFDSAPEDFLTWAEEIAKVDADVSLAAFPLVGLNVPTPTITVDAEAEPTAATVTVDADATAGPGVVTSAPVVTLVSPTPSAGDTQQGAAATAATVTFAGGTITRSVSATAGTTSTAVAVGAGTPTIAVDERLDVSAATLTFGIGTAVATVNGEASPPAVAVTLGSGVPELGSGELVAVTPATVAVTAPTVTTQVDPGVQLQSAVVAVTANATAQGQGSAPATAIEVAVGCGTPTITVDAGAQPSATAVDVSPGTVDGTVGVVLEVVAPAVIPVGAGTVTVEVTSGEEIATEPTAATLALGCGTPTITVDAGVVVAAVVVSALTSGVGITAGATDLRIRLSSRRPTIEHTGREPNPTLAGRRHSTS